MHTYILIYIYTYAYGCTYVCTYTCIYINIYIYMYKSYTYNIAGYWLPVAAICRSQPLQGRSKKTEWPRKRTGQVCGHTIAQHHLPNCAGEQFGNIWHRVLTAAKLESGLKNNEVAESRLKKGMPIKNEGRKSHRHEQIYHSRPH